MAILEEHWLGFDPKFGATPAAGCPFLDLAGCIIWYERWSFTGWSLGNKRNTGISYTHCYVTFDHVGNVLSDQATSDLLCCGFAGNTTGSPTRPPPSPDEWLARARAVCEKYNLPPPGTIMLHPDATKILGVRG